MRIVSVLVACLLAACTPLQNGPVSRGDALAPSSATTPPLVQPSASVAPVALSNADIAKLFLRLNFDLESGQELSRLSRFEGPLSIVMTGNPPAGARQEMDALLQRFKTEAGLTFHAAPSADAAAITVNFAPSADMKRLVPSAACFVVPGVSSLAQYLGLRGSSAVDWANIIQRGRVAVFVPSDASPQEVRDCLHEEIAQAIGPLNDLYELGDSVFNDDNFHTVLTSFDMLMLRLHYVPELHSGMSAQQVASLLPEILGRLNPAGVNGAAGLVQSKSPLNWNSLANKAMGLGGKGGSMSAAQQMIAMAKTRGWTDNRLGLAYFLAGRLAAKSNVARANEYFTSASQVYRSLPSSALHLAHVDLQLAAIALSRGQNQQAITLVDRSTAAVRAGRNSAMLSTMLLIKAEALEGLGHFDQARALRLDTAEMARYGFGTDEALRTKLAEVASLGARG